MNKNISLWVLFVALCAQPQCFGWKVEFAECSDGTIIEVEHDVKNLDLSWQGIKKILPGAGDLEYLEVLNLTFNELTKIPEAVANLKKMRILRAAYNQINHIPRNLGCLKKLRVLDLTCNRFTAIPLVLADLHRLCMVSISCGCEDPRSVGEKNEVPVLGGYEVLSSGIVYSGGGNHVGMRVEWLRRDIDLLSDARSIGGFFDICGLSKCKRGKCSGFDAEHLFYLEEKFEKLYGGPLEGRMDVVDR